MKLKFLMACVLGAVLFGGDPAISQEVTTGVIETDSASLEYFSRGEGEAVVLLPGGTLTVGYLDAFADALAAKGYRVIGINFPGSGKSTGPDKGVTLEMMADQVAGVIQSLGVEPAHVAGNDFGNRVARMLAASHPELVKSVILLAAGGKIAPAPAANNALMVMFNPASSDEEILKVMPFFVSNPADSQKVFDMMKSSRAPAAAAIEKMASESTPLDVWWAPAGDTEYLILQGADDQIAPPANGEELKGELGDRATLINVPGAAHLLPLEQPGVAAAHVDEFIKSLGSSQ
ncbi:MAG: alpha/beta hydrolase [Hyphomonas sp.]|nr:alpha/beta hydrolase [Hyphomonas sp.]